MQNLGIWMAPSGADWTRGILPSSPPNSAVEQGLRGWTMKADRKPKSIDELRHKSQARRRQLAAGSGDPSAGRPRRNEVTPTLELVTRELQQLKLPARNVRKSETVQ